MTISGACSFTDEDVAELRDSLGLPGMCVLQFAFDGDPANPFLPRNHVANRVVYTGTHDNDTTLGWFATAGEEARRHALDYLDSDGRDFAWDLIRAGMMSVANTFIAPMQDVLSLGTEARMNYPSKMGGWWVWRVPPSALTRELSAGLRKMAETYGRAPK